MQSRGALWIQEEWDGSASYLSPLTSSTGSFHSLQPGSIVACALVFVCRQNLAKFWPFAWKVLSLEISPATAGNGFWF